MSEVAAEDLVTTPRAFATNAMIIAVPPDNPAGIERFADLVKNDAQVVVCAPEVPCGAATERLEAITGVTLQPVSEEASVTDVLNKVRTGEADAGVVYVTDVAAAGDEVTGIAVPPDVNTVNTYPIAAVRDSSQADLAQAFTDLVIGPDGERALADAGFGPP
jgi:molybdate transport system substrate-binding protein